jgi:hypothetical protein
MGSDLLSKRASRKGPDQTQENISIRPAPEELRKTAITGLSLTVQVFIFLLMATWPALITVISK